MAVEEEDRIRKIEGLLNLAADPRTPDAERENAQNMADKLMFKYRIDQALLFMRSPSAKAREVVSRKIDKIRTDEFSHIINYMRESVFMHFGCMTHDDWSELTVVGYAEEISAAEMMWATVMLHFTRTVFPKWEDNRSFDGNVYALKSAGYGWPYVCAQGLKHNAADQSGPLTQKNSGSKLRSAFKREAKRLGIEVLPGRQQPAQPQKWRNSFASSYYTKLTQRLAEMQRANEKEAGEAGVLALVSEQDRVKQTFYALFPELNPEVRKRRTAEAKAAEEARRAALTPAQLRAEDMKNERARARAMNRINNYYDDAGWNAGHRAAESIDLGGGRLGKSERNALQ